MSDHIGSLIDAYLDNELLPSKISAVEDHLTHCELCQSELKHRRQLVALLKSAPPAPAIQPKEQFVTNFRSQLTPRSNKAWMRHSVLKLGWQAVPVGLMLVITFIQTVSFLGVVTQIIPGGWDVLLDSLPGSPVEFTLIDPLRIVFGFWGVFRMPDWNWITGMAATFIISITYISWMVIWWSQYQSANDRRMII